MSEALFILAAFGCGAGLGVAFFSGLWWTVRRVASGRGGAWLLAASSILRMSLALAGFWLASHGEPARLVACLAGWMFARRIIMRRPAPAVAGGWKGGAACD